jgi:hypothetical protein
MEGKMYRTEDKQQLAFKDFYLPFGGKLNPTNRWVQLAQLIPWGGFGRGIRRRVRY